jgi:hypothetical protein
MDLPTRLALACAVALGCVGPALAQDAKPAPPSEEDTRLKRIIERWLEQNESERDHVLREVTRAGNGKATDNFAEWYTRLGGDDKGWDRTCVQRKAVGDIFDRIAWRLELQGPVLKRSQFLAYAEKHWGKENSPRWRAPPPFNAMREAERTFKQLDRNRDGWLSPSEIPPALRADMKRWDKDGDGWISYAEYRTYFAHRLDKVFREWQQKADRPLPALVIQEPDSDEPMVMRAGALPPGLPAWFSQLDEDGDGQIGLYEWRQAGWSIEEFQKLDHNDDGFLEPAEILRALAITERDGTRPFEYLYRKRIE